MADGETEDDEFFVFNLDNKAVVADAVTPETFFGASEGFTVAAGRGGVLKVVLYPFLDLLGGCSIYFFDLFVELGVGIDFIHGLIEIVKFFL